MDGNYEHIWERTLPEVHHVALCDLYHLTKFLGASRGRRDQYFMTVAEGREILERALHREPTEQDVLSWIAFVLGRDRTFLPHVCKHGGAAEALDPAKWRLVLEAGAGAIMGEYLIANEDKGPS
jgi:hypothetical protein